MDDIPLQTLKVIEKVTSEEQVNNISVQIASVLRNFKPTVRSRREFEPDESVGFDTEFEKELNQIESEVDNIYLKESLPKIETELNLLVRDYKHLLTYYSKLNETDVKNQVELKESDEKIQEKLDRVVIVEDIRKSLLSEVRKLCLILDKTKVEYGQKLRRATSNFRDAIHYLNRGFEAERINNFETLEILRKLEHTLRNTVNECQNSQEYAKALEDELKKTKLSLQKCERDLEEHEKLSKKSSITIRNLEQELEIAKDRATNAEDNLARCQSKLGIRPKLRNFLNR
ncbi:CLUMA_CG016567, isoform A [Clunio marinus]|uniref:CLUMA_CG016567, isoform A n=1 Tax=Clunio marinus TaxID=568069 RepID=A0A1J1ISF4_9DIPT|nr:CLUMA_CG016567, isoform A [Clunio marinus]